MNNKKLMYKYGIFRLKLDYKSPDFCQVTMYDDSSLQFPLLWSLPMTQEQADKAIKTFKKSGYFSFSEIEHL